MFSVLVCFRRNRRKETTIRRQFESLRIRLEQDMNNLIEELTQLRNSRIKEMQEFNSELQVTITNQMLEKDVFNRS